MWNLKSGILVDINFSIVDFYALNDVEGTKG